MNIVIIGQGAIGLLWYHQLSKNPSNQLSIVCSPRSKLAPLETTFTDIDKQISHNPLTIANKPAVRNAELILLCVKSYQLESALRPLLKQINVSTTIIFCHNGMNDFSQSTPLPQPCYTLLTTHASKIVQPFHAQHTGLGHSDLGLIAGSIKASTQKELLSTLASALPSLTLSQNIKEKQWLKLAINCVINPITAIDNVENGQLLNDKYNTLIDKLLSEVILVAAYENVKFEFNDLQEKVMQVVKNTAQNCSSMRSDILQQRKTEIDYINGYIVNLAESVGISVPENEKLVQQVKMLTI